MDGKVGKNTILQPGDSFPVRDLRRKRYFQVDDLFIDVYASKCGVYATGVYMSLCRHADKNRRCWPSYARMAEELGISTKQVGRALKLLERQNIVKKMRLGKKLNNRYLLLDPSEWTGSPFTRDAQALHPGTTSPIHSNDTQVSTQHNGVLSKRELAEEYKRGVRRFKPFYNGCPMRWVPVQKKWFVIEKDRWLEFADKESKIEWR